MSNFFRRYRRSFQNVKVESAILKSVNKIEDEIENTILETFDGKVAKYEIPGISLIEFRDLKERYRQDGWAVTLREDTKGIELRDYNEVFPEDNNIIREFHDSKVRGDIPENSRLLITPISNKRQEEIRKELSHWFSNGLYNI